LSCYQSIQSVNHAAGDAPYVSLKKRIAFIHRLTYMAVSRYMACCLMLILKQIR